MKQKWEYKKLGDIATFINGYPFKPSEWQTDGLPIIRIQNLNNPSAEFNFYRESLDERYNVTSGDVLISWSGSLGVYEWSGQDALLNQHIFKVKFDKLNIDKDYFKYAVSSRIEEMKGKVHGITMQHITKGDFDRTLVPVPPKDVQERIVEELDLLTGVIDKQKAQLQELDTLAQSIFYDMFGDPIENPKGWDVRSLKSLTSKIGSGATPKGGNESYKAEGITLIRSLNVYNGSFKYKDLAHIDDEQAAALDNVTLHAEDVLLNITGASVARCCIVPNELLPGRVNQHVAILRSKEGLLSKFLCAQLISAGYQRKLLHDSKANGATREALTKTQLENLPIIVPPVSIQQDFADRIASIEKQKAAITQSMAETQKLLDYTMDKYFG